MFNRIALIALFFLVVPALAVAPPSQINFQGVLRDSAGFPVADGTYAMLFRFYDAPTGGALLLMDVRSGPDELATTNGIFNVALGNSSNVVPGAFGDLAETFAMRSHVYVEVQVGNDIPMTPRIRLLGAPYALNAAHLDGRNASEFLDTGPVAQTKQGDLTIQRAGPARLTLESLGGVGSVSVLDLQTSSSGTASIIKYNSSGRLFVNTGSSGDLKLRGANGVRLTTSEDVVTITTDGKVGIGTDLPVEALDVDGTIQADSFVGDGSQLTGLPQQGCSSSADDPTLTFTVIREHRYSFSMPLGQFERKSTLDGEQGEAEAPASNDPQLQFGDIFPCVGVTPSANNIVVTGIEVRAPFGVGDGAPQATAIASPTHVLLREVLADPTEPPIRRFEAWSAVREGPMIFHDDTGIRFAASSAIRLDTEMIGEGFGTVPMLVILTGYCAEESFNPPQNN